MGSLTKTYTMLLLIVLSVYCIQGALARSRSFAETEDSLTQSKPQQEAKSIITSVRYPRVHCEYEEATSDEVCEEECIPKGYTYGLCVNHSCSCV